MTIALLVYLGFGAYLYAFQRNILYYPSAPEDVDRLDKLWLNNEGEKILIWVINPNKANAILYFGGNAEAVTQNTADFSVLFPHHTVYLVNYRGYGGSTGTPSEAALYHDALATYDLITQQHDTISILGRSLGSGIGVHLAAERPIDKLALITPYDSIALVAQAKYPVYPIDLMLKDRFDAVERAPSVDANILLLVAEEDRLIRPNHAKRLAAALPQERLSMHILLGADHQSITGHAQYAHILSTFFNSDG